MQKVQEQKTRPNNGSTLKKKLGLLGDKSILMF